MRDGWRFHPHGNETKVLFVGSAAPSAIGVRGPAFIAGVFVGGYFLAKRLRNAWIGLAVGVAPFFVALYFFYQNVNRLLPAAL